MKCKHEWEDIAESRDYDGWYAWCANCGALKEPIGPNGKIHLPKNKEGK